MPATVLSSAMAMAASPARAARRIYSSGCDAPVRKVKLEVIDNSAYMSRYYIFTFCSFPEGCGFCSQASGFTTTFNFNKDGNDLTRLKNNLGFVLQGDANDKVRFDTLILSKAGLDLFNITDSSFKVQKLADVTLAKESVKGCYHSPMIVHGETVEVGNLTELFASVPPQDP